MSRTLEELKLKQSAPLSIKIKMTEQRVRDWVNYFGEDGVYVAFSGGKDSTALLHIVRNMYPDVPAVFCDTGLEFPEVRDFVKTYDNVVRLHPKMTFRKVIEKYGYPIISKDISQAVYDVMRQAENNNLDVRETNLYQRNFTRESEYSKKYPAYCRDKWDFLFDADFKISHMCCFIMKKNISKEYEKESGRKAILGTMAHESRLRRSIWQKYGCNGFDAKRQTSRPFSFWNENDVLLYLKQHNIPIASIYGDIVEEDELPGQLTWDDYCGYDTGDKLLTTTGEKRTGCMFCAYGCHNPVNGERFKQMKYTHPKQYDYIMRPWKDGGLGYKHVFDWLNEHGNLDIKY